MKNRQPTRYTAILILAWSIGATPLDAETTTVAVASNFATTARRIADAFEMQSQHDVTLVTGSSAKLYAQIRRGAPFDVFLSADQSKPGVLVDDHLTANASQLTYAIGRLVLWSRRANGDIDGQALLTDNIASTLAIANPRLAPYGIAAEQTLLALNGTSNTGHRLVYGENVAQAFQFVASGNADYGLVALSQVLALARTDRGSLWIVPQRYYTPVYQDAVWLKAAANKPAAAEFFAFLTSPAAQQIVADSGYYTVNE